MSAGETMNVRSASEDDLAGLAHMCARALQDDPFFAWVMPDDAERARKGPKAYEVMLRSLMSTGSVYTTDDLSACTSWERPGTRMSTGQRMKLRPDLIRAFGLRNLPRMVKAFSVSAAARPADRPHYYSAIVAADPSQPGRDLRSTVLQPALHQCDLEEIAAYSETASPAGVEFFRQHGFDVATEFALPKGPTCWGMWRDPRPLV